MSRIGNLPISIPDSVNIILEKSKIITKGNFGILELIIPKIISVKKIQNKLTVNLNSNSKNVKSLHGLYRTLINNMVIGVSKQFTKTLVLKGVGYRAVIQNGNIILNLGYSHPVIIKIPKNISIEIVKNTTIHLKSCDKELLGLFASKIRAWRKPEPYNGKGILFKDEFILRKAGKSAK